LKRKKERNKVRTYTERKEERHKSRKRRKKL
jgi:hypothetical protein